MSSSKTVTAKIYRHDPASGEAPRYDTLEIPFEKHMRVLDVLDQAVDDCGVAVGYRWFCGVKRCGMCGVSVNGKPVLACWEAASPDMVIEPLANMPVVRDLVVDRSALEDATIEMEPCLKRKTPYESFPEPLTHNDFKDAFKLMNCIECYVCTAACPVLKDAECKSFAGPGTLVQLAKVALHPKDEGDRVAAALKADIYACISCYECSNACPVGINVLEDAIEPLKRRCAAQPEASEGARHAQLFSDLIRKHGRMHPPTLMRQSQGLLQSVGKMSQAITLYRKGKVQIRPQTIDDIDSVRKLFDATEKDQ